MELYKKHRPTKLKEIVGNRETVTTLQGMMESKNLPHTFLLTGSTGTGKTTLARILAKEVGSNGDDLKEINSADFRGIDTIRSIIRNASYSPSVSKARVWILDEVHMLNGISQNALLKVLEDTPSHVYFILCTTDPQKLIKPIKSRCSLFQMNVLDEDEADILLKSTVKKENETLDKKVSEQIVKTSLGHPRNALQILEQVLSTPKKNRLKIASKLITTETQSIDLARVLIKKGTGWKEVRMLLKGLKKDDAESIRYSVIGYCSAVLLNRDDEHIGFVLETFIDNFYDSNFSGLVLACYTVIKR